MSTTRLLAGACGLLLVAVALGFAPTAAAQGARPECPCWTMDDLIAGSPLLCEHERNIDGQPIGVRVTLSNSLAKDQTDVLCDTAAATIDADELLLINPDPTTQKPTPACAIREAAGGAGSELLCRPLLGPDFGACSALVHAMCRGLD